MEYDIYFHNDFDGTASAALMLYFLEQKGHRVKNFYPVEHGIKDQWEKLKFRRPAVILDYTYHPDATYWFDHHGFPFVSEASAKKFKANACKQWNKEYASCYHLVADSLAKHFNFELPSNLRSLVPWLDMWDGARFESPKQAVEAKEAPLKLGTYVEDKKNYSNKRIIKLIAYEPAEKIVKLPDVRRALREFEKGRKELIGIYKKLVVWHPKIAFVNLGARIKKSAFLPYYLDPKIKYTLFLRKKKNVFHLSLGANPWLNYDGPNIGTYLEKRFGGGGHEMVGGAELKGSPAQVLASCNSIIDDFEKAA